MRVPGVPFVQGRNDYDDRDGRKYGIAIHNTSNDASDEGEASYATRRTDGIGSHFYADADSVIQSIDTDDRVGHAGSYEGNEHAIAFELTGSNGKSRQWWLDSIAWDKVAYVIAFMLKHDPDLAGFQIRRATVAEMQANPKVKAFYGHDDMRRAWGGTTHTDPGGNFPWDYLFASVKQAMQPATPPPVQEDDMSERASQVIEAWARGNPEDASGTSVEPVIWRIRDEAWQKRVDGLLVAVAASVEGLDMDAVLRRLDEHAAAEATRDAEMPGRILAALPDGSGPVSREDLEAALRSVLGSVDNGPQG